jgi:hypothetical protein
MKTRKDAERDREGRRSDEATTHAPDGERGDGNPRRPQRDLSREGDVLNPDIKEPSPRAPDLRKRVEESNVDSRPGGSGGHEADPPKPRKEEEPRNVPPYARDKSRARKEDGSAGNRKR